MGLAARLLPAGGCESDWVSHCRVPPALAATACEAVITDAAIRTCVNLSPAVLRFFVAVSADDAHGFLHWHSNPTRCHWCVQLSLLLQFSFRGADTSHHFHREGYIALYGECMELAKLVGC